MSDPWAAYNALIDELLLNYATQTESPGVDVLSRLNIIKYFMQLFHQYNSLYFPGMNDDLSSSITQHIMPEIEGFPLHP